MSSRTKRWLGRAWVPVVIVVLLVGYWLLPISGRVLFTAEEMFDGAAWPQVAVSPPDPQPGDIISIAVTDRLPWSNVRLVVGGTPADLSGWQEQPFPENWTWFWTASMPATGNADILFFVECHLGCKERARLHLSANDERAVERNSIGGATKLCTVLPNPNRNWHGRQGFVVDMTYMRLADDMVDSYWSVDALAERVYAATAKGVRTLIRVEFDRGQTLPPENDHIALSQYLAFVSRLANDDRLQSAEAFVIGTGPNSTGSNSLAPDRLVTPEWFARVLNGYGEPVDHADNVVQTMHRIRADARVIAGSVRPWVTDQNGRRTYTIDAPWLNYMNTFVWALDQSTRQKNESGIVDAGLDGFALQAPGNPDTAEIQIRSAEPSKDLRKQEWNGAQAGFRVYSDWLEIINAYTTTHGLPAYITATNTYTGLSDETPAQNYPEGWLSNALSVVNQEPQIRSLCWFMDGVPNDAQWDEFSLTVHPGQLIYAADEFDALLQQEQIE